MSNDVSITFAGDSKDVQRALDQMGQAVDKADAKLERLAQKGQKGAKDSASGFQNLNKTILDTATGAVAGFASMATAGRLFDAVVSGINDSLQTTIKLRNEALGTQLNFAQAMERTRDAFTADATLGEAGLEQAIIAGAKEAGIDPAKLAKSLETGFSAGSGTNREILNAAVQAARLRKDEDAVTALLGGSLDLEQATGTSDARVNLGALLQTLGNARVTDIAQGATNLTPAIVALRQSGDTAEEAQEMVAVLTKLSNDPTGASSGTAAITLDKALSGFVLKPDKSGKLTATTETGESIDVPPEQLAAFRELQGSTARMEFLRQNKELREAFLGANNFEARADPGIRRLIRGEAGAMAIQADVQAGIQGSGTEAERTALQNLFEEEVNSRRQGQFDPILTADREAKLKKTIRELQDNKGARAASARQKFTEVIEDLDLPGNDKFLGGGNEPKVKGLLAKFEGEPGAPEDAALDVLGQLVGKKPIQDRSGSVLREIGQLDPNSPDAQRVKDLISVLERQKAASERNNQLLEKQVQVLESIDRKTEGNAPRQNERPAAALSRNN